ncbi:MAG: hypothetical protein NTY02_05300, partial [Acidobacteria bacterium]|nr:hypothetical protein [Acidobacteriota bacterium]
YLASQVGSADFKPTDQQIEVQKLLEERLATYQNLLNTLLARELSAYNELLLKRNVPHIITTAADVTAQGPAAAAKTLGR